MLNLGIGILTFNKPITLKNTLESYKKNNLFDLCNEKIILLQSNNNIERAIAEEYNLQILCTEKNIGIGPGNNMLINNLSSKYILILQNDFELITDNLLDIQKGINMIQEGKINCYRLRSLLYPGSPCYGANRQIQPYGNLELTHASEVLYYNFLKNCGKKYDEIFNNYENAVYIFSSKNCNYTENPCIYEKEWYINNISKYNNIEGIGAETNIQSFWQTQDFKIGMSDGIFTHHDMNT